MARAVTEASASPAETDLGETFHSSWLIWASAIERRESFRIRVARQPEVARLTEAFAEHSWSDETQELVTELRKGADRAELHPRRLWNILKRQLRTP